MLDIGNLKSEENKENKASLENGQKMVVDEISIDEDHEEYQYLNLIKSILKNGKVKIDRTNVGTKAIFGSQTRFSLRDSLFLNP